MENFKSLEEIDKPDSRRSYFGLVNNVTGEKKKYGIEDHYYSVSQYMLNKNVPEEIYSQFNVAKNVLLYAWYEYSFFGVAPFNVLSTLEMALKNRIGNDALIRLKRKHEANMYGYIKYSIEKSLIINKDLSAWHRAPFVNARDEYVMNKIREMKSLGLDSISVDYNDIDVSEENDFNLLENLQNTVNKVRNGYAHCE